MTSEAERRIKRAKASERRLGKFLMEHNGPDPKMTGIASSTGRVGHITNMQFDVISRDYAAENKQMLVTATLWGFWKKVVGKAQEYGKTPMLRWEPTNDDPYVNGVRVPTMHIISEERHAELLGYERAYWEKVESSTPSSGSVRSYSKETQLARGRGRGKARVR